MSRRHPARCRLLRIIGGATLAFSLLLLSGCAVRAPAPTATPTKTKVPTFTPAPPTATVTDTPLPAATPLPPPTATPLPPLPTATPLPPPRATPEPPPTPAPPTATPRPAAPRPTAQPVQPTAPPVAADPCAGIGGDGCKWRVTGGPQFAPNGGLELKLQFLFIHSGRNEPQGSYFVWLEKDGVKLPIADSVRSIAGSSSQGALGKYNYEYALGVDKLPGNTIAGHYRLWVLDGNGDRDSRNIEFDAPADQGQIWIQFDQA